MLTFNCRCPYCGVKYQNTACTCYNPGCPSKSIHYSDNTTMEQYQHTNSVQAKVIGELKEEIEKLEKQNQKYREALKEYADLDNWISEEMPSSFNNYKDLHYNVFISENDGCELAQAALEEEE